MQAPTSSTGPADPASEVLTDLWSERDILAATQAQWHMGSWDWHIPTGDVWWSDELYRILGRAAREFPATYEAYIAAVHPDDRGELERVLAATLDRGDRYSQEYRVVLPEGEVRHVLAEGVLTRADDGSPVRMLGMLRDITDEVRVRQERDAAVAALADSEARYRLLAENAWDVIWTMEIDGTISYVSSAVERVRGITPEEAMTQTIDQIHPPESAAKVSAYFAELYAAMAAGNVPPLYRGEHQYYRKDGSIMYGELDVIPQVGANGNVVRILGVTRDISERRRFEEELNRLAVTDPLTGVWNRRHGEQLLSADLAEARRYGTALSLLMLDLDYFKDINDTHGHQAGDRVLVDLVHRLQTNLRGSDVLVRWGGEEFVVLLRHSPLADAMSLAEKIRTLVADAPFPEVGAVTVSIGATELRLDDDLASWLDRADQAMYDAKRAGRNAVRSR